MHFAAIRFPLTILASAAVALFAASSVQGAAGTATVGQTVTFSVTADGTTPFTYQWSKGGTNIAGATGATYSITSVQLTDAGNYCVVVSNSAGSTTSDDAALTVNPAGSAPVFTTPPQNQTVTAGQNTTFTVAASGNPAPAYQWQRLPAGSATWENLNDGGSYHGVTSATLTVNATTSAMSGDQFRCVITNSAGSSTSDAVALTVPGAATALLQYPASIAEDGSGNFYVADAFNNTIQKITSAGVVSTLAGSAGQAGSQDGVGVNARFNQPSGVVVASNGNVYVADTGNATIRKIASDGTVTTLAGSPATRGNTDGVGSAASFSSPAGIAVDSGGNLYVADAMNATVRKIAPDGTVSTVAGTPGNRGDADGTGAAARFNFPNGIAVDAGGNLYVADTYNDTIRKITPAGVVTTLAGSAGISGGNDGMGGSALFNQAYGLTVDAAGNVYVADTGNATIRKVTTGGAVTTLAGTPGIAGLGDSAGGIVLFNQPHGLVIDGAGNIFVADTGNATIRKIAAAGTVTTLSMTPAQSGATPPPSTGGNSSSGTGTATATASGGGGAVEPWFVLLLMLLSAASWTVRRLPELPARRS